MAYAKRLLCFKHMPTVLRGLHILDHDDNPPRSCPPCWVEWDDSTLVATCEFFLKSLNKGRLAPTCRILILIAIGHYWNYIGLHRRGICVHHLGNIEESLCLFQGLSNF